MSTRAVYTFVDANSEFHVYKHSDGYPRGAAQAIIKALTVAWSLPRYEADDFAASFVSANKTGPGAVRLIPSGKFEDVAPMDVEYHYVVSPGKGGQLLVTAYAVDGWDNEWKREKLFVAPLKSGETLLKKAC
jgi:hypothetical protein